MQIEPRYSGKTAFLHLGFRPFFFFAIAFALLSMLLWLLIYSSGYSLLSPNYPGITWHAHEMVFGYAAAVIAGFLLTAVKNWTGIQTINHIPLLLLVLLWISARLMIFIPASWVLVPVAFADCLFLLILTIAFSYPLLKTRQWHNFAFSGKLALLFIANVIYYLGVFDYLENGINYGLYGGFYVVLAIIFNMGRRVIPFFIEKGLGCPFQAKNYRWVDLSSLFFFLLFAVADIIQPNSKLVALFAAILLLIHTVRLYGWYHPDIWKKSLLWVLFVGYAWIVLGFAMKVAAAFGLIGTNLSLHAFAYGGIGMVTAGMMARVSLGHTGNNVFEPPRLLSFIFALLFAGAVVRVILPIFITTNYPQLIMLSQLLWIAAFALFFFRYAPMLIKARVDGRYG